MDDEAAEAIVRGRRPRDGGFESLVEFTRDLHAFADGPVPMPNASLMAVLQTGFSTDKGDLLVTAGSNVNGPAEQAAGLPKWRKQRSMVPTGIFSGLVAKVIAGAVAALAGVTAAGAAGALPGPAQHAVASVINTITPLDLPDGNTNANATISTHVSADPSSPGAGVSVDGGAGAAGAGVGVGAGVSGGTSGVGASVGVGTTTPTSAGAGVTTTVKPSLLPSIPGLSGLPGVPNLSSLPIPDCVKNIVDVKTGQPKVPLSQVSSQVIACVKTLFASSTAQLPTGVNSCVSSILGLVGNVGTNPGSVPNISGLDLSKCVPVDITKCMSSIAGFVQGFLPGGGLGFSFGGSASTGGSAGASGSIGAGIPGLSILGSLSGCLPFNLDKCLTSIFDMAGNLPGVGTGGIPGLGGGTLPSVGSLDLSACVPLGSLSSIPGLGNLSALLPH